MNETLPIRLLTQRPPFPLGAVPVSLGELLEQVQTRQPEPPSSIRPEIPRDLEVICLKCLEKEPGQRYASAEGLAEDLARYRAGEPIKARPVGRFTRFWKWCRRNPYIAASLTVIALLLSAFIVGLFLSIRTLKRQQDQTDRALQRAELTTVSSQNLVLEMVARLENKHLSPSPETEALKRSLSETALRLLQGYLNLESEFPVSRSSSFTAYIFIGHVHRCRGERDKAQEAYR